jgi:hypothetical protein
MPTIQFTGTGTSANGAAHALTRAAVAASRAPSLLAGQPWRWRICDEVAELRADRLASPGPDGRRALLIATGGAALHHAYTSLAGAGVMTEVLRLPDPTDPDLLARIVVHGFNEPDSAAVRLQRAIGLRRVEVPASDSRPIPPGTAHELSRIASAYGAHLRPLAAQPISGACAMLLSTDQDTALARLLAGEAYSAIALTVTVNGLVMAPIPDEALISVAPKGALMSQPYDGPGYPLVVLTVAGRR